VTFDVFFVDRFAHLVVVFFSGALQQVLRAALVELAPPAFRATLVSWVRSDQRDFAEFRVQWVTLDLLDRRALLG